MDALSAAMASNLQSLQQSISMTVMRKAMNADTASADALIQSIEEANPTAPPSNHMVDVLA